MKRLVNVLISELARFASRILARFHYNVSKGGRIVRVVQLIDALDFGDGVSNEVISIHGLLNDMGVKNQIYSKWWDERVKGYTQPIEKCVVRRDDLVLYHFSGESTIFETAAGFSCKRIVRYHNVTPPAFFRETNPQVFQACKKGLHQIQNNIHRFDGFWAVSPFNAKELIAYGAEPSEVNVLPNILDFSEMEKQPFDKGLFDRLKKGEPYILFVGRVAPNKCIEDILDVFENFYCYHNRNVNLYLVGNAEQSSEYVSRIASKLDHLKSKNNVFLTGKISNEELYAYYRGASAFICMSEHEGFCRPLLEAQFFNIPIIAYSATAVPDTMGGSGILLYKKEPALAACLLDSILNDEELRATIIEKQQKNINQYRRAEVRARLETLLQKWGVKQ